MKITGIVVDQTNKDAIAFQTDPPVSEDVIKWITPEDRGGIKFSQTDGILVASNSALIMSLDEHLIEDFNRILSNSERRIKEAEDRAHKQRQRLLEDLSRNSGLPLVNQSTGTALPKRVSIEQTRRIVEVETAEEAHSYFGVGWVLIGAPIRNVGSGDNRREWQYFTLAWQQEGAPVYPTPRKSPSQIIAEQNAIEKLAREALDNPLSS